MSQQRQIAKIRPLDAIVDVQADDLPPEVWSGLLNVAFRRNQAQRVLGYSSVFAGSTEGPVHLRPLLTPVAPYWLYATDADSIFVTDGTTHFDITPTVAPAPTINDAWTSTALNGIAVMNDNSGAPWYWDNQTANPMLPLPGWQAGHNCRVIRSYKNYLIAMAYDDGVNFIPDLVVWSDAAEPGTVPQEWLPSASNDAGFRSLSDSPGEILDGQTLRDQFIIYAKNAVYTLNFIGGNFIFALRQLVSSTGILARNCVVEVAGKHYALTDNDIVAHDGHSARSLLDRRWRRFFFERLDESVAYASFVALYEEQNEIWFCIPQTGDTYPTAALIYNYKEDRIGFREFDPCPHGAAGTLPQGTTTTIDSLTGTIDDLFGTIDGLSSIGGDNDEMLLATTETERFFQVDSADDLAGTPITATLARESLDFDMPDRVKTVKAIWPRIQFSAGSFEIRVGTQSAAYDPITWGQWLPWAGEDKVDVFATGRLISVEIRSQGGGVWRCSGFDVELSVRGRY